MEGKTFILVHPLVKRKKQIKKNKELKQYNLDDWLKWSGAIKGKCKPNLLYYSKDNCKECETFFPIWKQLEKEYKNEIFMDHIQEKHHSKFILEKHNVKKIPAIIFIPLKDLNKDGPIIHFKGKKTFEVQSLRPIFKGKTFAKMHIDIDEKKYELFLDDKKIGVV